MIKENKIRTIKAMGDEYITHKQAMGIFNKKTDSEKIKILTKALVEKCDSKDHAEYMILRQIKGVAYSDMWGDDKNGFLYKLYK
jgi:hypothetical protein